MIIFNVDYERSDWLADFRCRSLKTGQSSCNPVKQNISSIDFIILKLWTLKMVINAVLGFKKVKLHTWDWCNDFLKCFHLKNDVFDKNIASLFKTRIITLVFEKKLQYFCIKLAKIAENNVHNIDPSYDGKISLGAEVLKRKVCSQTNTAWPNLRESWKRIFAPIEKFAPSQCWDKLRWRLHIAKAQSWRLGMKMAPRHEDGAEAWRWRLGTNMAPRHEDGT
jgi:hypothetical protein